MLYVPQKNWKKKEAFIALRKKARAVLRTVLQLLRLEVEIESPTEPGTTIVGLFTKGRGS